MENNLRTQKDNLAKLMATEDLTIIHKKIPTAYFDIKNRILACPIFKDDLSSSLYDLFMGHEVGHALHTPLEGLHSTLKENRTLKGYLNVVEDVRIERKIREKYAGLRKSFYTAYNELMEMDFFQLKGRNLQELSLIDKINLITKCGSRVNIKLTDEEQVFLDWSEKCDTWEEVVECATAIYEWSKENETRDDSDESIVPSSYRYDIDDEDEEDDDDLSDSFDWGDSDDEDEESEGGDTPSGYSDEEGEDTLPDLDSDSEEGADSEEDAEEGNKETGAIGTDGNEGGKYDDEDGARESITEHNAHNNEEQFLSDEVIIKSYKKMKDVFDANDFSKIIVNYKKVIKDFSDWKDNKTDSEYYREDKVMQSWNKGVFSGKKLVAKNKAVVNHMAKEFEMRQSAQVSKYAFTGKTGKLDMNRLAKYQIVEDVFKRATYFPDGKNHGVQVLLDWSGSICNEAADLIEQSLVLAEFCRKVNIPHRVYLFSDAYSPDNADEYAYRNDESYLIELLSDKMSGRHYNEMLGVIGTLFNSYKFDNGGWRGIDKYMEQHNGWFTNPEHQESYDGGYYYTDFRTPNAYRLGGTPLDSSLVAMRQIIPAFNKEYNIEKSILTVISDGESHSSPYLQPTSEQHLDENEQRDGEDRWNSRTERFILDPYNNKPYLVEKSTRYYGSGNCFQRTQNLLDWLKKTTGVSVNGYFVLGKKQDFLWLLDTAQIEVPWDSKDKLWLETRKVGSVFPCHGYGTLFVAYSKGLGVDGSEGLSDELVDASKQKLKGAFMRNMKSKSTSRFLANEFIKEIA